jgi:hypothetical protein
MSTTVPSTTPRPQRPPTEADGPDNPQLRPLVIFALTALVVGWALLGPMVWLGLPVGAVRPCGHAAGADRSRRLSSRLERPAAPACALCCATPYACPVRCGGPRWQPSRCPA